MKELALLTLVGLSLLGGCAGTSKAPEEESAAAKDFRSVEGRGVVYLYRLGRAVGAATAVNVKINGLDAGGFGPGTFCRWELKPGKYTLHASTPESAATVSIDLKEGDVVFVEQNLRIGLTTGRVTMSRVDPKKGEAGVRDKKLIVSAYVPE